MVIWRYTVRIWDKHAEEDNKQICGVLCANNYVEAVQNLVEFYGDFSQEKAMDGIYDIITLRAISDGAVLPVGEEDGENISEKEILLTEIEENYVW